MSTLDIIRFYHAALLQGLEVTLKLAAICWFAGITVGLILGLSAHRWRRSVGLVLRLLSFIFAAIPPLVLLYWVHYPLQAALNVNIDPFVSAASVLSFLNTVIVAEVIRVSLDNFPSQYRLLARVNGLLPMETFRKIEFPIIARDVFPSILAAQVFILQATLFASLISVNELFRVAQRIDSEIYRPIQIYSAIAVFFVILCTPMYGFAFLMRRHFRHDLSER